MTPFIVCVLCFLLGYYFPGPKRGLRCLFGFHDWTDIIEDRVSYSNFSPEHYTTVTGLACMRGRCGAKKPVADIGV